MASLPKNPKRDDLVSWVQRTAKVSKSEADKIVTNASTWSRFSHDPQLLTEYMNSRIAIYQGDQRRAADKKTAANNTAASKLADAKKAAGLLHAMGLYNGPMDAAHLTSGDFRKSGAFIQALHDYQEKRHLTSTGSLDSATLKDINSSLQYFHQPAPAAPPPALGSASAAGGHPTDPAGIRALQQQLKDSGHDPGPIDGVWGPRTQAAYDASKGTTAPVAATSAPGGNAPAPAGGMSPEDIAYAAKQAGFTGDGLRNIVAIAMAESGGQAGAVGDSGQSHGLFQIYAPAHPQYDAGRLMSDPVYAATAAYSISKGGTDFSAWTTWTHSTESGAAHPAQAFLGRATQAVQAVETGYTPSSTSGSTGTPPVDTGALPPNATPAQVQAYVEKNYPQAAPFFANDEIRAILVDGARKNLDDTEIEARVRQTNYWQTHGADSRAFDAMIAEDPAGAGQLVDDTKKTVTAALAKQGVTIDDTRAGVIAKMAIRAGWVSKSGQIINQPRFDEFTANTLRNASQFYRVHGDAMIRNMDGSVVKASDSPWATKNDDGTYLVDAGTTLVTLSGQNIKPGQAPGVTAEHVALPSGDASNQADIYEAQAKRWGVPMTRQAAEDWALKKLQGTADDASFQGWLTIQAKGRWAGDPNVLSAIDQGIDPTTYFDASKTHIANLLELDPNSIDILGDPKYMQVTQFVDPKTGQRRSMTLGEVDQWARNQPGYANTAAYRQTNADIATKLGSFFGVAA